MPCHSFTIKRILWPLLPLCAALVVASGHLAKTAWAAEEAQKVVRREVHRTPDGSLIATVVFLKQRYYGDPPSRIEIRRKDGHLLAQKDYSSYRGQGYTVRKAAWTSDGRFFVYLMDSSGGHGPWHRPISFYSRKRHRFYSLDSAVCDMTGSMKLRKPCTVLMKGRYFGKSRPGLRVSTEPGDRSGANLLAIDLGRLEPQLDANMEDIKY